MKFRRKKPNYAHIAEMERDLDVNGVESVRSVVAEIDRDLAVVRLARLNARKAEGWSSGRGVVIDPEEVRRAAFRPQVASAYASSALSMAPGAVWPVEVHNCVQVVRSPLTVAGA